MSDDRERRDDGQGNAQRRHRRHSKTLFVWYQTLERDAGTSLEGVSYCVDVSRGGIGMALDRGIEKETLLVVEVAMDGSAFTAVCRTVYCSMVTEGEYKVGLEFVVLPPHALKFLAEKLGEG